MSPERGKDTAEYYKLNTRAVDELVNADASNSPPVSEAELKKYTSRGRFHLSLGTKAVLVKLWFAAATCFFLMFGTALTDALDLLFVLAVGSGFITDLLTNNVLRFIASPPGAADRFMMYPMKRRFVTLPLNILHAGVTVWLTYSVYNLLYLWGGSAGVEPLGYGIIYTAIDLIIIGIKRLMCAIVHDAITH